MAKPPADFQWITALYGFSEDLDHIAVPEAGKKQMLKMANELAGSSGVLAIYIPEGTPDGYEPPDHSRGRVVGGVRLTLMPKGKRIEDYFFTDPVDGSRRWPIGWPCRVLFAPEAKDWPALREHVEHLWPTIRSQDFAGKFLQGPFRLVPNLRERLNRDFSNIIPLVEGEMEQG